MSMTPRGLNRRGGDGNYTEDFEFDDFKDAERLKNQIEGCIKHGKSHEAYHTWIRNSKAN